MSGIAKLRKDELQRWRDGLIPEGSKKIYLKPLIEENGVFKNDFKFVKSIIDQVLEEKKNQKSNHDCQMELVI